MFQDLGNTTCAIGLSHAHAHTHGHNVTGMTGVHGTGMGTPMHHQYRYEIRCNFSSSVKSKEPRLKRRGAGITRCLLERLVVIIMLFSIGSYSGITYGNYVVSQYKNKSLQ